MTILRIGVLFTALALLAAACGGGSSGNETATPEQTAFETAPPETPFETAPPEQSPPTAPTEEPTPGLNSIYSPAVLAWRSLNHLVGEPPMEGEGLEFVLGARRERLEEIDHVTVHFPDGRTQRLNPSTDLGVPLDFFGYYGPGDGLPPAGDYVFEIVNKDGEILEPVNEYPGSDAHLPTWVEVEIDRAAGTISATWEALDIRNYTVDLQEIDAATGAYTFVGAGCPDPDTVDPNHLDASYLTEARCVMTGLNDVLRPGVEYGVQVAVWSETYYGGIDGAVIFTW